jgi:hypothetical protein
MNMEYKIPSDVVLVRIDEDVCAQLKVGDMLTLDVFGGLSYRVGQEDDPELDAETLTERKAGEHLFLYIDKRMDTGMHEPYLLLRGHDLKLGVFKSVYE